MDATLIERLITEVKWTEDELSAVGQRLKMRAAPIGWIPTQEIE